MLQTEDITLRWIQQIYTKNDKPINFCNKVNAKRFRELQTILSIPGRLAINYIIGHLKYYAGDMESTMKITIDWNDENCKNEISKKKSNFYSAINELEQNLVIYKVSPKTYLVSPDVICYFTYKERTYYHSLIYARYQELLRNNRLSE